MINEMIKNKILLFAFISGLIFTSCSSDTEDFEEEATAPEVPSVDLEVENFIYRGMSDIYLYKDDVDELADNYFGSTADKEDFLADFSSPEKLFDGLTSSQDRFSYLIEDYNEMNKMASGTETTTGMNFGLVTYCNSCSEVFGYVKLVLPGSTAAENGVERGMIFNRVDGQQLTKSNINSLLNASSFSIGLAKIDGNTISELDRSITLTERSVSSNPVLISKVLEVDGNKTGYLLYNSFDADFDEELNTALGEFKSAGIKDLVLDLRYNGGGSVRTATDLAAMITGQFSGKVFMKEKWNQKYQTYYEQREPESLLNKFNTELRTGTPINSLNLNRVFVLTTGQSASASELIINGLDPYIDVVHIGEVTTGKFQASVTLYDSPNFSEDHNALKKTHTYALQPLVLKSSNANDVSDYVNGLNPDFKLQEDVLNMGKLGDATEPLLKLAIDIIKGNRISIPDVKAYKEVGNSEMNKPNYQRMYIDKLPEIKQ